MCKSVKELINYLSFNILKANNGIIIRFILVIIFILFISNSTNKTNPLATFISLYMRQ